MKKEQGMFIGGSAMEREPEDMGIVAPLGMMAVLLVSVSVVWWLI